MGKQFSRFLIPQRQFNLHQQKDNFRVKCPFLLIFRVLMIEVFVMYSKYKLRSHPDKHFCVIFRIVLKLSSLILCFRSY